MYIIPILIGCIGIVVLLTTIIGITLHDIRLIRLEREFRHHPHARKWRKRPLVSIIINDTLSTALLAAIRASNYRKIQIVSRREDVTGELLLTMDPDTILEKTTISQAVRQFNSDPTLQSIEITPALRQPRTVRAFFRFYQAVASTPFIDVRAGLGVSFDRSSRTRLTRVGSLSALSLYSRIYILGRWLVSVANVYTILYTGYIAIVLYQPEYLLMYLAVFGAWMLWAISRYQHIRFMDKLTYFFLSPASLLYFTFRSLTMPLRLVIGAMIRA